MDPSHHNDFAQFADEVARLRGRIRAPFIATRRQTGLADMELTVLTAVVNAQQSPTVAQIGRSLGHPRQVVQRAANRLAELGLIELGANPDHKRASLLLVTEAGSSLKAADHQRSDAVVAALTARIGSERFAKAVKQLR